MNWSWILPETASTFGPTIDRMYYVILVITGVVFVLSEVCLVWFLVRYRHKEGRKAAYVHGNVTAEIVWTAIPFVIVVGIALMSRGTWSLVKNPENIPPGAMQVHLTAKQFEWNAVYAGPDGQFDTGDDVTSRNRLYVPVNTPVHITLMAEDVLHSFFLPDMRVKQDAVPGMEIPVWFEATREGEFPIGCAELCGIGHTRMRGTLFVQSDADHRGWLAEQAPAGTGDDGDDGEDDGDGQDGDGQDSQDNDDGPDQEDGQ